jgi:DNA-binding response OmpR family regulator
MLRDVGDRLLVMEDDDGIADPLLRALRREGYDVVRVASGTEGLETVRQGGIDLVLLDLGLPDVDGLEVCRRLREDDFEGGILILTARGTELDRVDGLDVGADDYLGKPFSLAELLARTRALLRRTRRASAPASTPPAKSEDSDEGLVVDRGARRAWLAGSELSLTEKEFDLLAQLATNPGAVVTRERLMDEVWDENWFGSTKTLDVTMARLRQKLESQGATGVIVTVRGVGFRLESGQVRVRP